MSSKFAKCSIIMPVKNGSQYIGKSIQSVLKQSFPDWKLIIVNDASTDETNEKVSEFLSDNRIQYISCSQSVGVSKARNIGLGEAEGSYVMFLDCDDCLLEHSIQNRIEQINECSAELGFFGTFIRKGNNIIKKLPKDIEYGGGCARIKNLWAELRNFKQEK